MPKHKLFTERAAEPDYKEILERLGTACLRCYGEINTQQGRRVGRKDLEVLLGFSRSDWKVRHHVSKKLTYHIRAKETGAWEACLQGTISPSVMPSPCISIQAPTPCGRAGGISKALLHSGYSGVQCVEPTLQAASHTHK